MREEVKLGFTKMCDRYNLVTSQFFCVKNLSWFNFFKVSLASITSQITKTVITEEHTNKRIYKTMKQNNEILNFLYRVSPKTEKLFKLLK